MRIDEIEYDDVTPEVDEYAGLSYLQRRRIEHFEDIGKPWLADAIRESNGLKPKHPKPKRKKYTDIHVDREHRETYFDDHKFINTPVCSVDKAMQCLKKIRLNDDKFI